LESLVGGCIRPILGLDPRQVMIVAVINAMGKKLIALGHGLFLVEVSKN
jgi:hypothetical protein